MSALPGNRYAEKWTYQRTYDYLLAIDRASLDEDCLYLGQALQISGLYDDIWRYWQRKWARRHEIISMMKSIVHRFEVRLFDRMVKGTIPARAAVFALRHHYGWGRETTTRRDEDLTYVDYELLPPDPQPESDTQKETEETPVPRPEIPTIESTGYSPAFHEYQRKKYHQENPTQPELSILATWHEGNPPDGIATIPFRNGYFIQT